MGEFLLFDASRNAYDDGEGNDVSFAEHLAYVRNYGGTPEFWNTVETDSRSCAMREARETGQHLYVVDDINFEVVGVVNSPS